MSVGDPNPPLAPQEQVQQPDQIASVPVAPRTYLPAEIWAMETFRTNLGVLMRGYLCPQNLLDEGKGKAPIPRDIVMRYNENGKTK